MDDFRVPTVQVDAVVLSVDGRELRGAVFMPALSAVQAGPMRPEEWVNGRVPFFPFRLADKHESVLLNKQQVLALTVSADAGGAEAEPEPDVPLRRVVVEAGSMRFEGRVLIDMPVNQRRVVDYLNRPESWLLLRDGDRRHLIRKSGILRVTELTEE